MKTAETWKAQIGDIVLADRIYRSGAAFLLSKKPAQKALYLGEDKWSIEVSPSCRYIVAKCKNDISEHDIFDKSYEACQKALDLWAFSGTLLANTEDVVSEHLIWMRAKRKTVVKSYSVARMGMRASGKVEIRNKDGTLISTMHPSPIYHDSLRFYRLSQATDDLFDAFRNMYLCFERLIAYKYPFSKKFDKKESVWLRRALNEAHAKYILPNVYNSSPGKVVEDIYKNIYIETRCKVFHAKDGLSILTPQDTFASKKVDDSLDKLGDIVVRLCRSVLYVDRPGGVFSNYFLKLMAEGALKDTVITVSDYNNDVSPSDSIAVFSGSACSSRPATSPKSTKSGIDSVLATFPASSLRSLAGINSYFVVKDNHLLICSKLEGTLKIKGSCIFEPTIGSVVEDLNRPRLYYKR